MKTLVMDRNFSWEQKLQLGMKTLVWDEKFSLGRKLELGTKTLVEDENLSWGQKLELGMKAWVGDENFCWGQELQLGKKTWVGDKNLSWGRKLELGTKTWVGYQNFSWGQKLEFGSINQWFTSNKLSLNAKKQIIPVFINPVKKMTSLLCYQSWLPMIMLLRGRNLLNFSEHFDSRRKTQESLPKFWTIIKEKLLSMTNEINYFWIRNIKTKSQFLSETNYSSSIIFALKIKELDDKTLMGFCKLLPVSVIESVTRPAKTNKFKKI